MENTTNKISKTQGKANKKEKRNCGCKINNEI